MAIALAWTGVAASAVPVARALRGDFRTESPRSRATGVLAPLDSATFPSRVRLDTATAVILVYSATCPACQANTDNWLRLRAAIRARHPDVPVFAVPAPQNRERRAEVPASLREALPEYRLESGTVKQSLGVDILPATVMVRHGRVEQVAYGIVGPRRRGRIIDLVQRGVE